VDRERVYIAGSEMADDAGEDAALGESPGADPAAAGSSIERRLAALEEALAALSVGTARLAQTSEATSQWLEAVHGGLDDVRIAYGGQLLDLQRWMASTVQTLGELSTAPVVPAAALQGGTSAERVDPVERVTRQLRVLATMRWLEMQAPASATEISVVLPTRNRADRLMRAVGSVLGQRHERLELLVVDDGSTDGTRDRLEGVDDPRLRVLGTNARGVAGARNAAMAAARGSIIAYLDDDNLMDPGWLQAVAWAFERWSEADVLYGARIVDDPAAVAGAYPPQAPAMDWPPYDRRRLERANFIDMNVLAHRAGLPGARFDESLRSHVDWDLIIRLTAGADPLELPAVACLYSTAAPGRISVDPDRLEDGRVVRSRVHRHRPLRVLGHNAIFPVLTESYIAEELAALESAGAEIACNSVAESVAPFETGWPLTHDLSASAASFDPDLLLVHWATQADAQLPAIEALGRPFAVRVHSFDWDVDTVEKLRDHPLCIGLWAYPHLARRVPGLHPLAAYFGAHLQLPPPADRRDLLLYVSAALPKRPFDLVLDVMETLADTLRCGIVLGRSNGYEAVADEVATQAAGLRRPPFVEIDVPRSRVFELLSQTSVLLHVARDDAVIGMPMSIIEAMRSGACIVHPDRPELREVVGPGYRGYHDARDIVRHVDEVVKGGSAIDEEREQNTTWALEQYCDPAFGRRFHAELSGALEAWRYKNG
jgi:glycosyltransferase involved in cell wall biosynthesis